MIVAVDIVQLEVLAAVVLLTGFLAWVIYEALRGIWS